MKLFKITLLITCLLNGLAVFGQTTIELNSGTSRVGVDLIYATAFDTKKKFLFLSRNIGSVDWKGQTSLISFNSLAYAFKSGIGIASNNIYTSGRFYSAWGLQYVYGSPDLQVYLYSTKELNHNNFHDHFIYLAWQPSVKNNWRLLFQNETNFTLFGGENAYTLQRIKLGVNYLEKIQFGLITEMASNQINFKPNIYNLGLFIKKLN
jgi:hypothetical protein